MPVCEHDALLEVVEWGPRSPSRGAVERSDLYEGRGRAHMREQTGGSVAGYYQLDPRLILSRSNAERLQHRLTARAYPAAYFW